ncbi:MAG: tRNA-uridine aminocarboxypropyltransferase [Kofleriaceae bacterium]
MCARCRRPVRVCYCAALPTLATQTRIVILQHPRERDMPIGTARMAQLCLPRAELHVGIRWGERSAFLRAISDPARPAVLLSPGPTARDIFRDPPEGPVTLVVVDGTWSQAKTVVRDNPCLQALPRYAFATPEPSQYRIRKEPRAEYVSTIEALMHVLGVLERDPARFRALLDPLNAMVDAQLAAQANAPRRTSFRKPKPPGSSQRRLPEAFVRRYTDLVCVVAEANAWPYEHGVKLHPDEVVHVVAERVATGERFDVIARPTGGLAPATTYHLGLTAEEFANGVPAVELAAAFGRFARPGDLVCAWGTHGMNSAVASGLALGADRIDLRAAAHRLLHKKFGNLDELVATYGPLAAADEPVRARLRLARAIQLVRAWAPTV